MLAWAVCKREEERETGFFLGLQLGVDPPHRQSWWQIDSERLLACREERGTERSGDKERKKIQCTP